jgi:hypothetical protein
MVNKIDSLNFYKNINSPAWNFSISKDGLHLLVGYNNNPGKMLYIKLESPFCFTNFKEVLEQDIIGCNSCDFAGIYSDDGTKLFVSSGNNALVYQYTLTTPYDVTSMTNQQNITGADIDFLNYLSPDGNYVYTCKFNNEIYRHATIGSFDYTSSALVKDQTLTTTLSDIMSFTFSDDGTRLYILDHAGLNKIQYYTLSTPWDLNSATLHSEKSTNSEGSFGDGIVYFEKSGNKYLVINKDHRYIYLYQIPSNGDISNMQLSDFIQVCNICFPAGTQVNTDQGKIAIEKLVPGVNTIDNKKIVTITETVMTDNRLVKIKKNALSKNIPNKDTTISGFHKVKHNGKLIESYKLANFYKDIKYIPYNGEVLYNVLMENWEIMQVHNMEVETLHPDNIIAKLHNSKLPEDQKLQLLGEISQAVINEDYEKFDLIKNHILN